MRKPDGEIYLVDMFFPQFKIYLEVNEAYHLEEQLLISCNGANLEITDWERYQITTHTNLIEINRSIEKFVSVLKEKRST